MQAHELRGFFEELQIGRIGRILRSIIELMSRLLRRASSQIEDSTIRSESMTFHVCSLEGLLSGRRTAASRHCERSEAI